MNVGLLHERTPRSASAPFVYARSALGGFGLLVALSASGCPTEDADADAGDDDVVDAGSACNANLPPPSAPCLEGQCGNALGVGQPCTAGGNECADLGVGNAVFCTSDFDSTDLWFCTKPCVIDSQCGEDAYCAVDPANPASGSGCVPLSCRDDDEPDGGVIDAGSEADGGG